MFVFHLSRSGLVRLFRPAVALLTKWRNPYRPERHYMRGRPSRHPHAQHL